MPPCIGSLTESEQPVEWIVIENTHRDYHKFDGKYGSDRCPSFEQPTCEPR